jgi:hypothetical protein
MYGNDLGGTPKVTRFAARSVAALAALALAVPASAGSGTTASINKWLVKTSNGNVTIQPGKTFKRCTQNHVTEIDAKGKVSGADKGGSYKAVWRKDGDKIITFNETWSKSSGKVKFSSLSNSVDDLPDGKFKVNVNQHGKTLTTAAIKLKTTGDCD